MYEQLWGIVLLYVTLPDKKLVDWVPLDDLEIFDIPQGPEFDKLRFDRLRLFDTRFLRQTMLSDGIINEIDDAFGRFTYITDDAWRLLESDLIEKKQRDIIIARNATKSGLDMIRRQPHLLNNRYLLENPHVELFMSRDEVLEICHREEFMAIFHLERNPNPSIMIEWIMGPNRAVLDQTYLVEWCMNLQNGTSKRNVARQLLSKPDDPYTDIETLVEWIEDPDIYHVLHEPQFSHLTLPIAYSNPEDISRIEAKYFADPQNTGSDDWELICQNPAAYKPGGIIEIEANKPCSELCWITVAQCPAAINIIKKYLENIDFYDLAKNPAAIDLIKELRPPYKQSGKYDRIGQNRAIYLDDKTTIPRLAKLIEPSDKEIIT